MSNLAAVKANFSVLTLNKNWFSKQVQRYSEVFSRTLFQLKTKLKLPDQVTEAWPSAIQCWLRPAKELLKADR